MSTVKILPNSRTETLLEKLVIQKAKDPCPLNQITYESRLSTFDNWSKCMKQKPSQLAASGFYW